MVKTQTTTIVNNLRGLTNEGFLFWLGASGYPHWWKDKYLYMCVFIHVCITENNAFIHVYHWKHCVDTSRHIFWLLLHWVGSVPYSYSTLHLLIVRTLHWHKELLLVWHRFTLKWKYNTCTKFSKLWLHSGRWQPFRKWMD